MQEKTADRRGRSHPPRCTSARDDRRIVRIHISNHSTTNSVCYALFGVRSYHSMPFSAEWNVHKASIASLTLDWKPQAFAPPMVR
ncbi:UNVERIFIED_CONTAM: hypothetical protein NCL1_53576 [Trichonephila clavipes]